MWYHQLQGTDIYKYYILCILPLLTQTFQQSYFKSAVLNSSPRARPHCIFRMLLLSLQMFVLFERKCPAKWTSHDIPPWFQFEANVYIQFKVHWSVQDVN